MAKGISTQGDVLVNSTADGIDLNEIWGDIEDVLKIWNEERTTITRLLSYRTTNVGDAIPQSITSDLFERATEFGEPQAIRPPSDVLKLGYSFADYDIGLRYTWQFLRSATAEQVRASFTRAIEADNRLVTGKILDRVLNPTVVQNEHLHNCYPIWAGDGMVPPTFMGKTFAGDHTHFLTTGSTVLDAQDVEAALKHIKHHGYGRQPGTRLLVLANMDDVEASGFSAWRAGVEYRTGAPLPKFDFIPSASAPAYLTDEHVVGATPPEEFEKLRVSGSYGDAWIIETEFIPAGWVVVVATGGLDSDVNPVAMREWPKEAYQGLRAIPGRNRGYPLQDSFLARGFGVGVRHRGAAVALQISTNPTYTAPSIVAHR